MVPEEQLKLGDASGSLGYFSYGEKEEGQPLGTILLVLTHALLQHQFEGDIESLHEAIGMVMVN